MSFDTARDRLNTLARREASEPILARFAAELARHGRSGVPLYLVYPANGGEPEVLPQLLTVGMVSAALERAARTE